MEQEVKILNKRGLKLAAVVHRPDKGENLPCILVIHGFTGFKEEEHIEATCKSLAQGNFVAIRFDASGFGESEGTLAKDYSVTNYLQDIADVFQYAKNLPYVNSKIVGICGHSLGGTLALIFTALNPEIKACFAMQPCTRLTRPESGLALEIWRQNNGFERICDPPHSGHIKLPVEMAEDADRYDALDYMATIRVPTAILYGTQDVDVLPSNSILLYEAATNCPRELISLDVDHCFKFEPAKTQLVANQVLKFFEQQLGTKQKEAYSLT
jgi:uncharacterized protein